MGYDRCNAKRWLVLTHLLGCGTTQGASCGLHAVLEAVGKMTNIYGVCMVVGSLIKIMIE